VVEETLRRGDDFNFTKEQHMKRVIAVAVFFLIPMSALAQHGFSANPAPTSQAAAPAGSLVPTADQQKDLEIAQLKAQVALGTYSDAVNAAKAAYNNYAPLRAELDTLSAKIIKDNGWPADTKFDPDAPPASMFSKPPAAPPPTPAPNPPAKP
jgi:hypothetical protein